MCGIAGTIDLRATKESLLALGPKMGDAIYHRGPDDYGYWVSDVAPILFVHRRLSIQDLSPLGHQPMTSNSQRYVIAFNGEIYNFKNLRRELEQLGCKFRGGSDTEVMLAAFECWGVTESVQKFVGMFAFAVFDQQEKKLILCKDRMGEKPLYYGWVNNRFVFASELKSITSKYKSALETDRASVSAYFRFGYIPTPYSIYKNIYKLVPGTLLELPLSAAEHANSFSPITDDADLSPSAYWTVMDAVRSGQQSRYTNANQAVQDLDDLLQIIIKDQSIADVPTGAFLSGGVDSTSVAAIMQSCSDKPIDTFTIGFHEKEFDEAPYAKAIAQHLGTNHNEHYISAKDCLAVADNIARYWDEPFADSSQIPTLIVSSFAKEKVTVCLSGDGGDELFCGYNRYLATDSLWKKVSKLPSPMRHVMSKLMLTVPPKAYSQVYTGAKKLLGNSATQANVGLKAHKFASLLQMSTIHEAYKYLLSYWDEPTGLVNSDREHSSILDRLAQPGCGSFIEDAMCWDQLGYLPDDNLVKGDRASMSASLETRLPLLDHRLIEYSWRLPQDMKYRDNRSKWALRQVLYRYVPEELIERPKMGFSVPVGEWLKGPLKSWAADMFFETGHDDMLNQSEISRVWNEHQSGSRDHAHKLWTLAMFKAWQAQYSSS